MKMWNCGNMGLVFCAKKEMADSWKGEDLTFSLVWAAEIMTAKLSRASMKSAPSMSFRLPREKNLNSRRLPEKRRQTGKLREMEAYLGKNEVERELEGRSQDWRPEVTSWVWRGGHLFIALCTESLLVL